MLLAGFGGMGLACVNLMRVVDSLKAVDELINTGTRKGASVISDVDLCSGFPIIGAEGHPGQAF